ncbi:unnamed protein product [Peronospora destructor]|uniref:Uncharacterized protein n=1 Tax=Peronospora destructor TaxID=86335 RepID=A0AAV0V1L1_9STRA|nr:unnamed protein product [Peronospora destructor]
MDQRNVPYGMPIGRRACIISPQPLAATRCTNNTQGYKQNLGELMCQHGVDDLDDLISTLGDFVGLQQQQHLGQMPNHVYDQQHLMPHHPQASNLLSGRTQGIPITSQTPPMQQNGMSGSMHLNQMSPNGVGAGGRMSVGIHQQPNMGTPVVSSNLGGLGISIPAPVSAVP